jgi:hypothetical protein
VAIDSSPAEAPAAPFLARPSLKGAAAALIVPTLFIVLGHLMILAWVQGPDWTWFLIVLVLLWPGFGLAFCPVVSGRIERSAGGSRGEVNAVRLLALGIFLLFGLIYIFGVPFDGQFFFGSFDSLDSGGFD